MSTSCLRKLNREREADLQKKLIKSYKQLFKIGININARSNFASLLNESERRLRDLMEVEVLTIVLVDHDQQMYFKLNPNGV